MSSKTLKTKKESLVVPGDLLLKEMRHRIANSLQLIASILLLKAESVKSKKTRFHLEDAHSRIMTIAKVQELLDPTALGGKEVNIGKYLTDLCESLAKSMIGNRKPISLEVHSEGSGTATSEEAVCFGLITTELVINSLKHAFPHDRKGNVLVSYAVKGEAWMLSVADDGIGKTTKTKVNQPGLGTGIVLALANQMRSKIKTKRTKSGTTVSIHHGEMARSEK